MIKLSQTDPGSPKTTVTADKVAASLSLAIHEHRLAPGTKLGEDEISELFGVSRTVVRAGLPSLAHQQLVEIQRNRGALVAQPSLREAREAFEREYLLTQINRFGGNISRTANFVGMERSALHRKLKSLGVVTSAKSGVRVAHMDEDADADAAE